MGRRAIPVTQDAISRTIKAVQKAGLEVKSIRVEPNGAVVINGDGDGYSQKELEESAAGYL
ncbi:hypothetical protein D9M68_748540 [compost metagenome]|uniref:hypothetical protein n=1 Tax=Sinorhizobium/Ensifer group TaxID=227292 RepID=UPI00071D6C64|nr:hypothetical protein [Sinorhizobium sp. Sb3]KSV69827.1 hypothetical protein N183_04165 [Sinorhizobium sp. Sb3]